MEQYPDSRSPEFLVRFGRQEFRQHSTLIADVTVETAVDGADRCQIELNPRFDREHGQFIDADLEQIGLGTGIDVRLGYVEDQLEPVFSGAVETIQPEFTSREPPLVKVTGYGHTREMMRGTRSDSWDGKALDEIVESVASGYFEEVRTEANEITPKTVIQDNEKDYRFLRRLASKYGYEFFSSVGTAYFRPRFGGLSPAEPVRTLTYGESLASFAAEKRAPEHAEVQIRYWDREQREYVTATAQNRSTMATGEQVFRINVASRAEAQQLAEAKLREEHVTGVVETFGIPSIVAGEVIRIDGVDQFDGNYYVTEAVHRVDGNGYRLTVEVRAI